jgi:EAL domain-containing protein (putative c-di-GMP-specific phosphodiesterase class I)
VEIKVDREFVSGCADDRLKKTMCRQIRELAENYGARTVAEGVDTREDFLAVRELGFDMVQGSLRGRAVAEVENRDDFLASRELGFDLTQRFLFGKPLVNRGFAAVRGLVA